MATKVVPNTFGLLSEKKRSKKTKNTNRYTVVSIRGYEEFFKGTYSTYKEAQKRARYIDSNLSRADKLRGDRTEIWTNYNELNGDVQTIHTVRPRRS